MNNQISWDSSLIKKYSSSNHYKLLNQLRSEVKKYPLTKKKDQNSNITNYNKLENITTSKEKNVDDLSFTNNTNINNYSKQSTVSFNNSKDFSIYNNTNDLDIDKNEVVDIDKKKSIDSSSTSFKDRLNRIDMK